MRTFKQLTNDELKKVYNNSEKLQQLVYNDAIENCNFWVSEYFNCFERGAIQYNIGYPGDYINVIDQNKFVTGLEKLQCTFEYLTEDAEKDLKYCIHLLDRFNNLSCYDDINAARLTNRIDGIIEDLKSAFLIALINEYDYYNDSEHTQQYFIENYAENLNDSYYIDDNFVLYQHIEYEKCYK